MLSFSQAGHRHPEHRVIVDLQHGYVFGLCRLQRAGGITFAWLLRRVKYRKVRWRLDAARVDLERRCYPDRNGYQFDKRGYPKMAYPLSIDDCANGLDQVYCSNDFFRMVCNPTSIAFRLLRLDGEPSSQRLRQERISRSRCCHRNDRVRRRTADCGHPAWRVL